MSELAGAVVVVGSLNCDFVTRVTRRPSGGETVMGQSFDLFVGGKGNNQAIACARAGADVSIVGRVGADAFADLIVERLDAAGVRRDHLARDLEAGTGVADIQVDATGQNAIVVVPRANARVCPSDIDAAGELLDRARVVLVQLEIPIDAVLHAAVRAKRAGAYVILNPAPAPAAPLPAALYASIDLITPNESEARSLTGVDARDDEGAEAAGRALLRLGAPRSLLTLGERGTLLVEASGVARAPAFPVDVVDTTAAGDAFCGALAAQLASGASLERAIAFGRAAGALACTRLGAEPSLPLRAEIDELMARGGARRALS